MGPRRLSACQTALFVCCLGLPLGTDRPAGAADSAARATLPGENAGTGRRLAAADQLVANQQWTDAIDEYQRILDEAGDDLVPLNAGHCVQARRLCHLRLASLPEAARSLYRERVDGLARKRLEQGEANRDERVLRRVVDETFCSRATERALDLLGDLAFERGDFVAAERWWRLLALPAAEVEARKQGAAGNPLELVFPDPQGDLARVRAKQLLARLFRGEREGFDEELKAYRALHGKAAGDFAGRQGNYADTLQALAGQPETLTAPGEDPWTTFAGNPTRSLVLPRAPGGLPWSLTADREHWPQALDACDLAPLRQRQPDRVTPPSVAARSLAFHPVIIDNQILVAGAGCVDAYDLSTGERTVWYDLFRDGKNANMNLSSQVPADPDVRYTLTVAEDRIYVRLGTPGLGPRKNNPKGGDSDSFLVCLNLHPEKEGGRERWIQPANQKEADDYVDIFEGSPVVHDGRVYVALTRFAGTSAVTSIACYDADTGVPRWRSPVEVCQTRGHKENERRWRHHLLTLAGPHVVYCSHAGAVIALDGATGRRAWAVRYPSRGNRRADGTPSPRDLCPAVFAMGRLFVAPADYDRILCLDPDTGRTRWRSEPPVEVVHLLGVARGRLIFTTPDDIRALDAATGAAGGGWLQPAAGRLPPFGRGFLAGDLVFWPTVKGLRVLQQETGEPAEEGYTLSLDRKRLGNLALGNGCLVVANETQLWAYVPASRLLERRRKQAAGSESALHSYQLALAEADAGMGARALEDFTRAEHLARADDPLHEQARACRQLLLLDLAERSRAAQQRAEAAALLQQAAGVDFPVPERLHALAREADLWASAGQPGRAVAVWQTVLGDDALSSGRTRTLQGLPQAGGTLAADRIAELIRTHGRAVYAPSEQQARILLAAAEGDRQVEMLQRLAREFPSAAVTRPALLRLAALHERAGRYGAAGRAYRLLLTTAARERSEDQAQALAGLARAYERQRCWEAARTAWQRLAQEYGDRTLSLLDPTRPVRVFVAAQLQKPEYRPVAEPALPFHTAWQVALSTGERLIIPADDRSPHDRHELFFVQGQELTCREADTGKTRWVRKWTHAPSWVGQYADVVLAAGADGVHGLALADGGLLWSFGPGSSSVGPWQRTDESDGQVLTGFRLAGPRLFFLQGERRLWALDVASGRLLWARWAPGARVEPLLPDGRFRPCYHAGADWVTVQTTDGKRLVLDGHTGRPVHETTVGTEPWPRAPWALDERRLCLVTAPRRLVLFDPGAGKELWTRQTSAPSISAAAPRVLSDGKTLLVLTDGWQLESLDPWTGEPRWQRAISTEPLDLSAAALDPTALYFVSRNVLHARALSDGRSLWQLPLGPSPQPWRVVYAQGALLVFPVKPEREPQRPWLSGDYLVVFPWEVEWHDLPVLVCDPRTGQVVQRLHFPASGPGVAVQAMDRGAAVGLAGNAWGLR